MPIFQAYQIDHPNYLEEDSEILGDVSEILERASEGLSPTSNHSPIFGGSMDPPPQQQEEEMEEARPYRRKLL